MRLFGRGESGFGGSEQHLGRKADFVVRVGVGEGDLAIRANEKDSRDREQMVDLSGGGFEIDVVALVFFDGCVVDTEGDAERQCGLHRVVGEQCVGEIERFIALREFRGAIRADRDDLIA